MFILRYNDFVDVFQGLFATNLIALFCKGFKVDLGACPQVVHSIGDGDRLVHNKHFSLFANLHTFLILTDLWFPVQFVINQYALIACFSILVYFMITYYF